MGGMTAMSLVNQFPIDHKNSVSDFDCCSMQAFFYCSQITAAKVDHIESKLKRREVS
jgi:hypothetical protein